MLIIFLLKITNLIIKKLKTYECEICGITEWENKNIVLQLHHIDGDNTNNEIQNLQILCPNCHSQTDNYCKRKICKDSKYCKICHKKINYNNKTGFCRNCLHIESLKKIKIPLNPKAKIYKLSKAEFQEIVNNSSSYKELAEKLQTKIETVTQALVYFDIDMRQFEINKFKKINNVENFIKNLSKNSKLTIHSSDLKKKLITLKLKENQCEMCGITEWENKNIVLQLHHIDGDHTNNELDNLQILCPNCHSQTNNYGKHESINKTKLIKKESKEICPICNKILKSKKAQMCKECYNKSKKQTKLIHKPKNKQKNKSTKEICPICNKNLKSKKAQMCRKCKDKIKSEQKSSVITREELKELIRTKSFLQISKIFNVSDNAIRKWCDKYKLPRHKREIDNYTDEEWKKI